LPFASSYRLITTWFSTATFLQGSFTSLVHAHAGRTQAGQHGLAIPLRFIASQLPLSLDFSEEQLKLYNLLITGRSGAWDLGAYEYDRDRFLEYSADKEKALFKSLTLENIELLKSFPCLFAYEGTDEDVRVGYLRSIKERGFTIFVEFEFDPDILPIAFSAIKPLQSILDYRKGETYRTHWAVKDENLFERLHAVGLVGECFVNVAGNTGRLEELRFKVAFSFPGELRGRVSEIARLVKDELPRGSVFYDDDFTAQLARPNLDSLLQTVYLNNSQLVVVFLSGDYERKMWCGIEWRAVRGIINNKSDHSVMFVRSDDIEVPGVFSHDGYIDLNRFDGAQVSGFILERVRLNGEQKI